MKINHYKWKRTMLMFFIAWCLFINGNDASMSDSESIKKFNEISQNSDNKYEFENNNIIISQTSQTSVNTTASFSYNNKNKTFIKKTTKAKITKRNKKTSSYRRQFYDLIFRQSFPQDKKNLGRKRTRSSALRGKFNLVGGRRFKPSLLSSTPSVKHLKYNPHLLRNNCSYHACYAPIRNLLVGRKKFIYASSTCGQRIPERFCILGYTPTLRRDTSDSRSFLSFVFNDRIMPSACFTCDSRDTYEHNTNSHRIENVVKTRASFSDLSGRGGVDKWWQSENGKHKVYIQFDLEGEFILSHVLMRFKSYPPAAMLFEKSTNYGQSWHTIAYFADNCAENFPGVSTTTTANTQHSLDEAYCLSLYSNKISSTNNDVVYRPLSGLRGINPIQLQNSLKITNLRFNLTQLHMFGDNLIGGGNYDADSDTMSKYFYAINEIKVFGSCFCNGHANECVKESSIEYDEEGRNEIVYSKCKCQHNTHGQSCQTCLPLYNDRPWEPAQYDRANECKRCNCNGHATSCHFDEELYRLSNGTTGGVCDNCMHNTIGANCQLCARHFYRDTSVPFDSPEACKPCKCSAIGTVNRNPYYNEPTCHTKNCECKINVEGENCDKCKNGFFNLSLSNGDEGCKKCDCQVEGTINNMGCDKTTGYCYPCKKNVAGEMCDQCKPGYFGLHADDEYGCQPCNCAPGNSYSNQCNQITGQCSCKPNTYGRRCNVFEEGFYCPSLDHLIFEAEDSFRLNNNSHLNERRFEPQISRDLDAIKWTGNGFMKVYDGGQLKFNLNQSYTTGLYDIVMRYEPNEFDWDFVLVKIKDMDAKMRYGVQIEPPAKSACSSLARGQREIEQISIRIQNNKKHVVLFASYCFQAFSKYELEITFNHGDSQRMHRSFNYNSAKNTPSIFIDSIVLIPDFSLLHETPDYSELQKQRMIQTGMVCRDKYLSLPRKKDLFCERSLCQITIDIFGLLACKCDSIGSNDNKCSLYGGQCSCKKNVFGRKCEKCRPAYYDFNEMGCHACNCDPSGSKTDMCDPQTGQCDCYENKRGKLCNDCLDGHFNPPTCEKCNCHGWSQNCTSNGICLSCSGNTEGYYCERCKDGYYGSPTTGIACKKCPCPGINGNNFATGCSFDQRENTFICHCKPGYTGERCEKCDTFHYGFPLEYRGSCKKCFCNGNENKYNLTCDARTGECKNCMYGTMGFFCDKCKPGLFGNPKDHDCKPCNCNTFGTEKNSADNCDPETGICQCLPKVIGRKCDECAADHWKLDSKEGCMPCKCDTTGTFSNSTHCDQNTGQCSCVEGRGGKRCDECPFNYWGSPRTECKKCTCSQEGVEISQCDRNDGHCMCRPGVTGYYCDRCARGTLGKAPHCKKCGECFDSWDQTILKLNAKIENLERKAIGIYASFGPDKTNITDFNTQYEVLVEKLNDVADIFNLNHTSRTKNLTYLEDDAKIIKNKILKSKEAFKHKIEKLEANQMGKEKIQNYQRKYSETNDETNRLLKLAIDLKESFALGAQLSIQNSKLLSDEASIILQNASNLFETDLNKTVHSLQNGLIESKDIIEKHLLKIKANINSSLVELRNVEAKLTELNSFVCGGSSINCSSKCGSIQCLKCGFFNENTDAYTNECSNGFESSYLSLKFKSQLFNDLYINKETEIKKYLSNINQNKFVFKKLNEEAFAQYKFINSSFKNLNLFGEMVKNLSHSAQNLSEQYLTNKRKIEQFCDHSLNLTLTVSDSDFNQTIRKVNELTNEFESLVNQIKQNTRVPLNMSIELKENVLNDRIITLLNETNLSELLNQTNDLIGMSKKSEVFLRDIKGLNDEINKENSKINETLLSVSFNLTKLDERQDIMEEALSLSEIKSDSVEQLNKLDSGKLKILMEKNRWTIDFGTEKLNNLTKDLEAFFAKIKDTSDPDTNENMSLLTELQNKIISKNNEMKNKKRKINEFEAKNRELESHLSELKNDLDELKVTTFSLNAELSEKLSFTKSCQ